MTFTFNLSTVTPGPFAARIEVTNQKSMERYKWENANYQTSKSLTVKIPQITKPAAYEMRLLLNEVVAYAGKFNPKEAPF